MTSNRSRIKILALGVLLFATVLVGRLYFLQVVNGATYVERADRQYLAPAQGLFERGSIYFTTKNSQLVGGATVKSGFFIYINPKLIKEPEAVYEKLNAITPLDSVDFMAKVSRPNDSYEEIKHRVEENVGKKIEELKLSGVSLAREKWRYYPGDNLAAHILGLIAYQGDKLAGRYGLERYYDQVLARNDRNSYQNFFAEIFSGVKKVLEKDSELEGNLVLTIEPTVESYLESRLSEIQNKWQSDATGGIIMNPTTGEIFAMAAVPTFNPNSFSEEKNSGIFSNPLVENVYEMGSIIKPLTMAAGLDAKAVTAKTTYDDVGVLTLDGKTIGNFDGKGRGVVDMQEVLNQSLNTGAAFIAEKLGNDGLTKYFKDFGLGEETGIDLPSEAVGLIANLDSSRQIEHATASFGQGIAMSPIITIRALAALGNGGFLPNPHLVKKIDYLIGTSAKKEYNENKQVIKKTTSEEITRMLVEVVDKALQNGAVKQKNYSIAAKTGTAQIAKPEGGGYFEDRFLHSFFGYFPAYNPSFIVFLYTVNPKGIKYASQTLTVPFMAIAKFLINYYNIPPDR